MIVNSFYLSDDNNVAFLADMLELSQDEIESMVGRFRDDHYRFAGQLKGEVVQYADGKIVIRHHFTKKKIETFFTKEKDNVW